MGLIIGAVLIAGLYAAYFLGVKVGKLESDAEWARKTAEYFEGKLDESLGMLSEQIKRDQFERAERELFGTGTYKPPTSGDTITWEYRDNVLYYGDQKIDDTWVVRDGDSFTITYPEASAIDVSRWNGEVWKGEILDE